MYRGEVWIVFCSRENCRQLKQSPGDCSSPFNALESSIHRSTSRTVFGFALTCFCFDLNNGMYHNDLITMLVYGSSYWNVFLVKARRAQLIWRILYSLTENRRILSTQLPFPKKCPKCLIEIFGNYRNYD